MSNTENQIELVNQFMSITSSNEDTARFYLDSAAWDVQAAVESYFENGLEVINDQNNLNASSERASNLIDQEDDIQIVEEHKPKATAPKKIAESFSSASQTPAQSAAPKPTKRFATLSDLGPSKKNNEESSESDSGNESPAGSKSKPAQQSFYVGGGEHSGQEVLGPKKPVKNASKMVDRIFKEAKALGAVDGSTSTSPSAVNDVFSGAGIRLGDSTSGSQILPGRAPSASLSPQIVPVRVAMYNNGLLVGDDANLRQYSDPETKAFISAVMKGQIPHELTARYPGSEIDLHMENHQNEEYVPAKAALQAFSGQGCMLGGVVPNVVGAGQVGPKSATSSSTPAPPTKSIDVDESKPTTRLRIRLLNGQQLVGRFNTSHRLSDVRNFIILQNSEYRTTPFNLLADFPPTKLVDENLTLEEAGILNAFIVQGKVV